jgi:outer membrane protein assembly factor BamD (BamD/ComL family)
MRFRLLPFARLWHAGLVSAVLLAGCQSGRPFSFAGKGPEEEKQVQQRPPKNDGQVRQVEYQAEPEDKSFSQSVKDFFTFGFFPPPKLPVGPVDAFVLRPDGLQPEEVPASGTNNGQLAGAHELFRRGEYAQAEAWFHRIADQSSNPVPVVVEARYYEAESLRMQGYWPKASDVYTDLLNKFPQNAYREQCLQHLFDIASFWLVDTYNEMRQNKEAAEHKRWIVWPNWVHWERRKPTFDEQSRALDKLEQVCFNDINGPLADQALFMAGSVKFYDEDFREAEHYFTQIHEKHPNSPLATNALKLGLISKCLSTGGPEYDGRKLTEARMLVDSAFRNYPELAKKEDTFLKDQLRNINVQMAAKDFKMAEYFQRKGHPAPAYFYYDLVRRRYPGTKWGDEAARRMEKLEREHGITPVSQTPPSEETAPSQPPAGPDQLPPPRKLPESLDR